jgi:hypothetical protein
MFSFSLPWSKPEFKDKYYRWAIATFQLGKPDRLLDINFQKPWWDMLWQMRFTFIHIALFYLSRNSFITFLPIGLGWIFSQGRFEMLPWLGLFWLVFLLWNMFWVNPIALLLYTKLINSFDFSAQKFFLSIDPIYHSLRASGVVVSKVNRAKDAIDMLVYMITENLMPTVVRLISAGFSLFILGPIPGLVSTTFVLLMIGLSCYIYLYQVNVFETKYIQNSDKAGQVSLENLTQTNLIRSTFATQNQLSKSKFLLQRARIDWNMKWRNLHICMFVLHLLNLMFLAGLAMWLVPRIQTGQINTGVGLGVLVACCLNFLDLIWVGEMFGRTATAVVQLKDTCDFIKNFGRQTFPVLENQVVDAKPETGSSLG